MPPQQRRRSGGSGRGFLLLILALIIVAAGAWYWYNDGFGIGESPGSATTTPQNGSTTTPLSIYTSEEFEVSLEYPSTWQLSSANLADGITPAINAYVPGVGTPPYTHHDNVTNISIFPNGIPTEGLFAPSRPLDFDPGFDFATSTSRIFTLEDGTPFAAYIRPASPPESWGGAGFVWVRAEIAGLATRCVDAEGATAPDTECDPPITEGYQTVWSGTRSVAEWNETLGILRSISFQL